MFGKKEKGKETLSGEEWFDCVDENDRLLGGVVSRKEAHETLAIHRAVTIFVQNNSGELFMIQRSKTKRENPLKWQGSASGHVKTGETYADAAGRELQEELGITAKLKPEFAVKVYSSQQRENFRLFSCRIDQRTAQKIVVNDEIEQGMFMPLGKIRSMVAEDQGRFRDAFVVMFNRKFGQ